MSGQQPFGGLPAPSGQPWQGQPPAPVPPNAPVARGNAYGTPFPQGPAYPGAGPYQGAGGSQRPSAQPSTTLPTPPHAPLTAGETYGLARPLEQHVSLGSTGPRPSGVLVALGVFLLTLSVIVPGILLILAVNAAAPGDPDPVWAFLVPIGAAVLTFGFAARTIGNGGARGRPLRALVHLVLGSAVLLLAVSLVTEATGLLLPAW